MMDKPNKVTATLKIVVTGEFYDDDSTEETLRYAVEQDLEDAGFDVDVSLLKEQEEIIQCKDCYYYHKPEYGFTIGDCTYRTSWYPVKENEFCSLAKRKEGR